MPAKICRLYKFLFAVRNYGIMEAISLACGYFRRRLAVMRGEMVENLYNGHSYPIFPPDVAHLECPLNLRGTSTEYQSPAPVVILHCYYPELLETLLPWLENLPAHAECYISTDTEAKKKIVETIFYELNFSLVDVRVFPNRGFDIGPFFAGFRDVLQQREIILKIHCKLSPQLNGAEVLAWNRLLLDSLLGSKERVRSILRAFQSDPSLGVIAPKKPDIPMAQGFNHYLMRRLLASYGIVLPRNASIDFPAGSMFWCRAKALRPWLNLNLSFLDFQDSASSPRDGTLAHALERLIFFGCGLEGLRWGRVED